MKTIIFSLTFAVMVSLGLSTIGFGQPGLDDEAASSRRLRLEEGFCVGPAPYGLLMGAFINLIDMEPGGFWEQPPYPNMRALFPALGVGFLWNHYRDESGPILTTDVMAPMMLGELPFVQVAAGLGFHSSTECPRVRVLPWDCWEQLCLFPLWGIRVRLAVDPAGHGAISIFYLHNPGTFPLEPGLWRKCSWLPYPGVSRHNFMLAVSIAFPSWRD